MTSEWHVLVDDDPTTCVNLRQGSNADGVTSGVRIGGPCVADDEVVVSFLVIVADNSEYSCSVFQQRVFVNCEYPQCDILKACIVMDPLDTGPACRIRCKCLGSDCEIVFYNRKWMSATLDVHVCDVNVIQ